MLEREDIADANDSADMEVDRVTYTVVRKYKDGSHPDNNKVISEGLTLEEAKAHCSDPDTSMPGVWFDCFYRED
jgi:hypothetical protein